MTSPLHILVHLLQLIFLCPDWLLLLACGVTKPLYAEDIIAQSKFRGKCSLQRVVSVQLVNGHEHVWTVQFVHGL